MPSLTPRATVVRALAAREAELLHQTPASGHLLVALIWVADGVGASALAEAGLEKGAETELRRRLADAPASARGVDEHVSLGVAAKLAGQYGHDYIGTEHQLLAVICDVSLDEALLGADVRRRARGYIDELFSRWSSAG
jgi:Clp amino terminal domain, pathogenicity island component